MCRESRLQLRLVLTFSPTAGACIDMYWHDLCLQDLTWPNIPIFLFQFSALNTRQAQTYITCYQLQNKL